jgi:SAM-dependent methyltransferase
MADLTSRLRDSAVKPRVVAVGGPSSLGKTSIISAMIAQHPSLYSRPKSYTSRPPRAGESEDEYSFVTRHEMLRLHQEGYFIALDDVYGHLYATARASILDILGSGKLSVKEVHPTNHTKLRACFPDLISVLLLPVSGNSPPTDDLQSLRATEDRIFYADLATNSFDVVLRVDRTQPLSVLAHNLHLAVSRVAITDDLFPRPPLIDAVNARGYNHAADEFTESRRITTANFHDLSLPFFSRCVNEYVQNGAHCLEIGPGRAWLRHSFVWPSAQYTAVDISTEMAALNQADTVAVSSIRSLDAPDATYDVVLASLADPYLYPAALVEIRRILKPRAPFVFTSPSGLWARALRPARGRNKTTFCLADGTSSEVYSFTFTVDELRCLLELCGFCCERIATAFGQELSASSPISPAIIQAAESTGVPLSQLPILDMVVARRHGLV